MFSRYTPTLVFEITLLLIVPFKLLPNETAEVVYPILYTPPEVTS